jgi:TM2 domain-containing membrane protein YozV
MKMKASYKAALLSAFVFPGAGQFYLKKVWRGLVIVLMFCAGLGYLIWSATVSAMSRIDDIVVNMQGNMKDLQKLSDLVGSKGSAADPTLDAVFYFMVCLWIFAVIDAYRIGRRRDRSGEETSNV